MHFRVHLEVYEEMELTNAPTELSRPTTCNNVVRHFSAISPARAGDFAGHGLISLVLPRAAKVTRVRALTNSTAATGTPPSPRPPTLTGLLSQSATEALSGRVTIYADQKAKTVLR